MLNNLGAVGVGGQSIVGDGCAVGSVGTIHPDHSMSYSLDSLASSFIGNEINETVDERKVSKYELPSYSTSINDNSFSKIESFKNRVKKNFHKKKAKKQQDLIKSIESYEKALEFCLKTNDNASAVGKIHVYWKFVCKKIFGEVSEGFTEEVE